LVLDAAWVDELPVLLREQGRASMLIGVFADVHDHVDHLRLAVAEFNRRGCELAVFAGDLVSTMCVPHLRELACPLVGCYGDNEGNRVGLAAGMRILGQLADPPLGFRAADGTKILLTHQLWLLGSENDDNLNGADVVIHAHTHKPRVTRDEAGRLFVNPGEVSGWTIRKPTVAILDTLSMSAEIVSLTTMPEVAPRRINASSQYR
jgi:putative phosphoesterase